MQMLFYSFEGKHNFPPLPMKFSNGENLSGNDLVPDQLSCNPVHFFNRSTCSLLQVPFHIIHCLY
jgi:hypothetical protein